MISSSVKYLSDTPLSKYYMLVNMLNTPPLVYEQIEQMYDAMQVEMI